MNSHIEYLQSRIKRLERDKEEAKQEITNLIVKSITINNDIMYLEAMVQHIDQKIETLQEELEESRWN